mmetsp:Transcript_132910/g.241989  ORF Transcript_132910/g.241989 Transcript_132910/m.241989 type:complete len:237 (+) Transcript_132910:606-1316(+)
MHGACHSHGGTHHARVGSPRARDCRRLLLLRWRSFLGDCRCFLHGQHLLCGRRWCRLSLLCLLGLERACGHALDDRSTSKMPAVVAAERQYGLRWCRRSCRRRLFHRLHLIRGRHFLRGFRRRLLGRLRLERARGHVLDDGTTNKVRAVIAAERQHGLCWRWRSFRRGRSLLCRLGLLCWLGLLHGRDLFRWLGRRCCQGVSQPLGAPGSHGGALHPRPTEGRLCWGCLFCWWLGW